MCHFRLETYVAADLKFHPILWKPEQKEEDLYGIINWIMMILATYVPNPKFLGVSMRSIRHTGLE